MAGSSIWAPVGDKGPIGDKGPVGDKGPIGDQGPPGPGADQFSIEIDSIAQLKLLDKTVYKFATTTGYWTPGDFGGANYRLDAADTTSADNGGTVIVGADGGRWKYVGVKFPTMNQWGCKTDGTSVVPYWNNMIAFANSRGGDDYGNIKGSGFSAAPGQYTFDQATTPLTSSGFGFNGGESQSVSFMLPFGVPGVFPIGGGAASPVNLVGCTYENIKLEYALTPNENSWAFVVSKASRIRFSNILAVNLGKFAKLGTAANATCGGVIIDKLVGSFANIPSCIAIEPAFGAGLSLLGCTTFVTGVGTPVHPANMTTAANRTFLGSQGGQWDTIIMTSCIQERFDYGVNFFAPLGSVYQNFYGSDNIFDYIRTTVVSLASGTGGILSTFMMANTWLVSWEGPAIQLTGGGINDFHRFEGKVVIAGQEAVNYVVAGPTSNTFCLEIGAVNRVTTTSNAALNFVSTATGFMVSGCKGNDDMTAYGTPWRAQFGIKIGADADNYLVTGNKMSGTTAGFSIAANTATSVKRKVNNNIGTGYSGSSPLAMPASGVRLINTSPFTWDLYFSGGTITGGYDKNNVGIPGALAFLQMRLEPGDSMACGYSAAPTLTRFILS